MTPTTAMSSLSFENGTINAGRTIDKDVNVMVGIQYFDGLGRPVQTVQKGVTPNKNDLVSIQEYDSFGRESNTWLPGYGSGNGAYTPFESVKSSAGSLNGDSKPYSMPVYEASPLNRVLEQYGPGNDWHTNRKAVRSGYLTNLEKTGRISGIGDSLVCARFVIGSQAVSLSGNYAVSQLYVTRMQDEDNNASYEFKDKLGQVVLTRQINEGQLYDTYYIYDDFGNLRYVLPPLLSDAFYQGTSGGDNIQSMKDYAYIYKYDYRNRCIKKRLPGCDWISYVYDKTDQLIFSQDGEQNIKGEWAFTKYDGLGRVILSGVQSLSKTHEQLISQYEHVVIRETSGSGAFSYTWSTMPDVNSSGVLTANYYDNYDFRTGSSYSSLVYDNRNEYGTRFGDDNNKVAAKGMLTGTAVALLDGTGQFLYSAMYYDECGRLIQTKSTNHLGGIEKEYIAYNFTGQPVKRLSEQSIEVKLTTNQPSPVVTTEMQTITEQYEYDYDHAGRLVKTTHQLDNKNPVILAENEYDELGRLKSTQANENTSLKTGYDYNIRSWITAINGIYQQSIYYNEEHPYEGGANTPLYNGNITHTWGYNFVYDGLSRLLRADDALAKIGTDRHIRLSTNYGYDKHGNIANLRRNGKTTSSGYGIIDQLDVNYTGNQLRKVTDTGNEVLISESNDFKDYVNQDVEYTFNANGSMTSDLNKGITRIRYNSLNLPQHITINNNLTKGEISYVYSAAGQRLKAIYSHNNRPPINPIEGLGEIPSVKEQSLLPIGENIIQLPDMYKYYAGNKIYKEEEGGAQIIVGTHINIALDKILIDNGYIENGIYYFYQKDHLGNNRMVVDGLGQIVQKTDYYPFGTPYAESTGQGIQPFKYGSKEFDTMHGLNQYDFHARQYDPAIGGFTTPDPLAEQFYSISPYVYCLNNPLRYTDPTGMSASDTLNGYLPEVVVNTQGKKQTDFSLLWIEPSIPKEYTDGSQVHIMGINHLPLPGGSLKSLWQSIKSIPYIIKNIGNIFKAAKITTEALLKAGNALDKGGLTKLGRALMKHGSRTNSVFPKAIGNPSTINQQGEKVLKSILNDPNVQSATRNHARFGDVLEFKIPGGPGARFSSDGKSFIGFLEP